MKEYEYLICTFNNVNKWLEHAEKKNAYLFSVFSSISLLTIIFNNLNKISELMKISITIFIGLYLLSLFFTVLSLFPTTRVSKKILEYGKNTKLLSTDNLLFWKDIAKYSVNEYKELVNKKCEINIEESKFSYNIIEQIVINANIAEKKYLCFKISSSILFIGIMQLFIVLSISIFK